MLSKILYSALRLIFAALILIFVVMGILVVMWAWVEDWAAGHVSVYALLHSDYPTECGRLCIPDFWEAASIADIEEELANGADINGSKRRAALNSPLHLAIENQANFSTIEMMLKRGANPNASGHTIIHGYHPDQWDESHRTPLQLALDKYNRSPALIALLLEYGANPNPPYDYDYYDEAPLINVSDMWGDSDTAIATLLLQYGADINARTIDGLTPLHLAAVESEPNVLELFLRHGAYVDARTNPRSAKFGGSWATPLHIAAKDNQHLDSIVLLLEYGADVNAKKAKGETPLHLASSFNENLEVIALLLDRGADVNAKNENGNTPLLDTILSHQPRHGVMLEVIHLLLEGGADVNAKNVHGDTPMHKADPTLVPLLLDYGADVNARTVTGVAPLHEIMEHNPSPDVVAMLLDHGADVSAKTLGSGEDDCHYSQWPCWRTPLHQAAASASPEVIELLLEYGADINTKTMDGRTSLHWAAAGNPNHGVLEVLLENGADPNLKDEDDRTACQVAEDTDRDIEVIRLLC